jgi:hypothetical protein
MNDMAEQSKKSSPENPYKPLLTQHEKLRIFQVERCSISKMLACTRKEMRLLEGSEVVKLYLKACDVCGTGQVQLYLKTFESMKKLVARLSAVDKDIYVHQTGCNVNSTAASNMLSLNQGFNLEEVAFHHPLDNMTVEELSKYPINVVDNVMNDFQEGSNFHSMTAFVTPMKMNDRSDVLPVPLKSEYRSDDLPVAVQLKLGDEPSKSITDIVIGGNIGEEEGKKVWNCINAEGQELGNDEVVSAETNEVVSLVECNSEVVSKSAKRLRGSKKTAKGKQCPPDYGRL